MIKESMFSFSEAVTDRVSRLSEPLSSESFDEQWRSRWRRLSVEIADLSTLAQAGLMLLEFDEHA